MNDVEKSNKLAVIIYKGDCKTILAGKYDSDDLWELKHSTDDKENKAMVSIYQHKFIRDISLTIISSLHGTNYIYNIDDTNNTELELIDICKENGLSDRYNLNTLYNELLVSDDVELVHRNVDSTEFNINIFNENIKIIFHNRYNILYNSKPIQIIM